MSILIKCCRRLPAVILLSVMAGPGCRGLIDTARREPPPAPPESSSQTDSAAATADSPADRAVFARSLARDENGRSHSVWVRAVAPTDHRWRYADLEDVLARPPRRRPDLQRYLADEDPIVAANAAIALARSDDPGGAERLAEAVRAPKIPLPMRCAAAEALAGLADPSAVESVRELLDQYGNRAGGSGSVYIGQLHAELIRGLARHVDPADDRRFVDALVSPSADVQLEALRAWTDGRQAELPVEAADLRTNGNHRVRAAAIRALAARRHPQAHEFLLAGLRDHELRVQTAAVAGLGMLGGDRSQNALEELLQHRSERIRSEAVAALARLNAGQVVLEAAGDDSWRVRLRVARALAAWPDRKTAAVAEQLLDDPSVEVQREVVASLARWPLDRAGPLLLRAMGKAALLTRKSAAEQLADRWPPAAEFPVEGPPDRRAKVLEKLQQGFGQQVGFVDRAALAEAAVGPGEQVTPAQLARVEQLVRQQDTAALAEFGPGLVEALEQLVFDRKQLLPEAVYRDVLPRYGPVFAALDRLNASATDQRRRAAAALVELAEGRPLGRLATARLAQLAAGEEDQLVWQSVLTAVAGDPSEPAMRLATAAIGHPSPEVRRRACQHLAAHPHPSHARVLLPALEDRNLSVVCAAVGALGAAGRMEDTEPLRRLLLKTNEPLRLETAAALTRLRDPAGPPALERLAHSAEPKVRRRVAMVMGELPDPSFVPTLVRLLDDRASVRRAALENLPKVVGHDASKQDQPPPANTTEQVRRWKRWFQQQAAPPRPPRR